MRVGCMVYEAVRKDLRSASRSHHSWLRRGANGGQMSGWKYYRCHEERTLHIFELSIVDDMYSIVASRTDP